jgi:hypothetical protein
MDFARWFTHGGVPGAGPYVESAQRTGANTVVATINLNGHSGLAGRLGSTGITGFALSENGFSSAYTITSAVLSRNQILLTFSATPNAPIQLRYDATIYGATDNIVMTTDNAVADTLGVPLQTTAYALKVGYEH